jgi:structural maintenance of chromosomes protein 6
LSRFSSEIASREKAMNDRETKLSGIVEKLTKINETHSKYQDEYEKLSLQHSERQGAIDAAKSYKIRTENKISDFKKQQKSKYEAYPNGTKVLLEEIKKKSKQFESPPIGPIAILLNLKQMKWASAVESCLRDGCKIYIVHSYADEKLMRQICKDKNINVPSMLISKHTDKTYQIHPNKLPDTQFKTVLDLLELDESFLKQCPVKYDPNVLKSTILNALIDQSKVESIILIEDRVEASDVMFSKNPPKNVSECFTITGTRLFSKGGSHTTQAQNKESKYWVEDYKSAIQQLESQLEDQEKKIQAEIEEKNRIPSKNELEKKISEIKVQKSSLLRDKSTLERELQKIKSEPIEEEEDRTSIIEEWKKEILEKQNIIKQYEESIQEDENQITEIADELKKIYDERSSSESGKKTIEKSVAKFEEQLTKLMKDQARVQSEKNSYEKQIKLHDQHIQLLEGKLKTLKVELEQETSHAIDICPVRVDTDKSSKEITEKRRALQIRLERESEKFGTTTVEDIKKKYHDKKRLLDETEISLKKTEASLKSIQDALNDRFKKWEKIRTVFSRVVSDQFNLYLAERAHTGSVEFDHQNETMEIQVQLESLKQIGKDLVIKDTKSLSGGERSYSTVSLLLALWSVVDSPFRALDEFDIFMDAIYRKESMDLLIKIAKKNHSNRQLIILTPHDTSQIKLDSDIKIFKLKKPQRGSGQTILDQYSV